MINHLQILESQNDSDEAESKNFDRRKYNVMDRSNDRKFTDKN